MSEETSVVYLNAFDQIPVPVLVRTIDWFVANWESSKLPTIARITKKAHEIGDNRGVLRKEMMGVVLERYIAEVGPDPSPIIACPYASPIALCHNYNDNRATRKPCDCNMDRDEYARRKAVHARIARQVRSEYGFGDDYRPRRARRTEAPADFQTEAKSVQHEFGETASVDDGG